MATIDEARCDHALHTLRRWQESDTVALRDWQAGKPVAPDAMQQPPVARVSGAAASDSNGPFADKSPDEVARWAGGALRRSRLRIVDTETTGRGPRWGGGVDEVDEVVDICVLDGTGAVLLDTLVKPQGMMHPRASAINGITDAMLEACDPFSAIAAQVREHLQGMDVVIFNAEYDTKVIADAFALCGQTAPTYEARCAKLAYHRFKGRTFEKWVSLEAACRAEGIVPQGTAHRAQGDCLRTLALLQCMAERAPGASARR